MKTFRSTLNTYFIACSLVLATTLVAMLPEPLAPYRNALGATLGLAEDQLWTLAVPLALALLATLSLRLRAELSAPIHSLSEQCAIDSVAPDNARGQLREMRIIRDFIRQSQNRANSRAEQIYRMEAALLNTRKQNERHIRKVEELEDLIASYGRIRNELNYDNSLLRQENRNQATQINALETQLARSGQTSLRSH